MNFLLQLTDDELLKLHRYAVCTGTIVLHTPTEKIYNLLMQKLENMWVEW